jgi:hypothetical protein
VFDTRPATDERRPFGNRLWPHFVPAPEKEKEGAKEKAFEHGTHLRHRTLLCESHYSVGRNGVAEAPIFLNAECALGNKWTWGMECQMVFSPHFLSVKDETVNGKSDADNRNYTGLKAVMTPVVIQYQSTA